MTTWVWIGGVVAAIVVLGGLFLLATANRLDRLHVRTDAGWAAAAILGDDELRTLGERAERAPRPDREAEESELTLRLARVDRAALPSTLAEELTDAEHRVVIARRVHNDAVRDTLHLRRRRKVRYFGLAGTARLPEYFEIAEPEL